MSWLDFLTDCFTTVTMGLIPRAESDEEKVKQAQHEANMQHAQMNPQKLTEIKNTNEQTQKNEQKKEIDNKIGNSNINTNYDDARFEYNNKLSNVQ
uniref:Uncharacterized protein n=1 Tax=Strongyloides papillosus TaxID=174720 RepID=A0A0N5C6A7_STREA